MILLAGGDILEDLIQKTIEERNKKMIFFYGSDYNKIRKNIWTLFNVVKEWSKKGLRTSPKYYTGCLYDEKKLDFRNKTADSEAKYFYENEIIYRDNVCIAMSLYYDYVLKREMFMIYVDKNTVDPNNLKPHNLLITVGNKGMGAAFYRQLDELKYTNKEILEERAEISKDDRKNKDIEFFGDRIETIPESGYVLNLHVCETCSFNCAYCNYSKWKTGRNVSERMKGIIRFKNILRKLSGHKFIREINFVGGDPTFYTDLPQILKEFKRKFKFSMTANCYHIDDDFINKTAKYFDTIYLEIDSFDSDVLFRIGQTTLRAKYAKLSRIKKICNLIKEVNPECRIVFKTVVTKYNISELFIEDVIDEKLPVDAIEFIGCINHAKELINVSIDKYLEYIENTEKYKKESNSEIEIISHCGFNDKAINMDLFYEIWGTSKENEIIPYNSNNSTYYKALKALIADIEKDENS